MSLKKCEKELFEKIEISNPTFSNSGGFSKMWIILAIFLVIISGFMLWLKYDWGSFWAIDKCLDAGRVWNYEKKICE